MCSADSLMCKVAEVGVAVAIGYAYSTSGQRNYGRPSEKLKPDEMTAEKLFYSLCSTCEVLAKF